MALTFCMTFLQKEKCLRSAPLNGGSDGTYKVAAAITQFAGGSARTQDYEERREGAYARDELTNAPSLLSSKSSVQKGGGHILGSLRYMLLMKSLKKLES